MKIGLASIVGMSSKMERMEGSMQLWTLSPSLRRAAWVEIKRTNVAFLWCQKKEEEERPFSHLLLHTAGKASLNKNTFYQWKINSPKVKM